MNAPLNKGDIFKIKTNLIVLAFEMLREHLCSLVIPNGRVFLSH